MYSLILQLLLKIGVIYENIIQVYDLVKSTNIIANMCKFTTKSWFEIDESERKNVNVKDMFNDK